VGGGYPEEESGLAKFPLAWLIQEAEAQGLKVNKAMFNHLALGKPREGASRSYVAPDVTAKAHNSMTGVWKLLGTESRIIPEGSLIHWSVRERMQRVPEYRPKNLPAAYTVEGTVSDLA
jgi:hypothetical protein